MIALTKRYWSQSTIIFTNLTNWLRYHDTQRLFQKSYNYEGSPRFYITQHATMAMTELLLTGWQTINGKGLLLRDAKPWNRTFCHRDRAYNADDMAWLWSQEDLPAAIVSSTGRVMCNDKGEKSDFGFQKLTAGPLLRRWRQQVLGRFVAVDNSPAISTLKRVKRYTNRSVSSTVSSIPSLKMDIMVS